MAYIVLPPNSLASLLFIELANYVRFPGIPVPAFPVGFVPDEGGERAAIARSSSIYSYLGFPRLSVLPRCIQLLC